MEQGDPEANHIWNTGLIGLSNPHILQSYEWGEIKACYGWFPTHKIWKDDNGRIVAAALILERSMPIFGIDNILRILYVPKGPLLLNWQDEALRNRILVDLANYAESRRAIFIKIDPDISIGTGIPGTESYSKIESGLMIENELHKHDWRFSNEQIQFQNTLILDLQFSEQELLASMKQKTRYNIRLAKRRGVNIQVGDESDFDILFNMYAETAVRDGFIIRKQEYYRNLWSTFVRANNARPIIAKFDGEPIAALILFWFHKKAYYMFGMSKQVHREKMPNYLLQWEAIKLAKRMGCIYYDLWGAPKIFKEDDPMWGVYRFKEGLGGKVISHIGAWDYTPRPYFYRIYNELIPRVLGWMRIRSKSSTLQLIE